MKARADSKNGWSLRRAYGISIALHVVFFAFFIAEPPQFGTGAPAGGGANEATTVAYLTIEHRAVVATPLRRVVAKPRQVAAKSAEPAPAPRPEPKHVAAQQLPATHAQRPSQDGNGVTQSARRESPGKIQVALATAPPDLRDAEPAHASVAQPVATAAPAAPVAAATEAAVAKAPPKPATADSPSTQTVAEGADIPPGGWGQSFAKPLLADDSALASLRTHYHGAIQVDVDESGKATHVVLPAGLTDDERADLEKRLLALRYVPAECNGLRCTGVMQLTL